MMSKPISDNPTYWDGVYSNFHKHETQRESVWNEQPTPFFERLIPFLKYQNVNKILDAGCGDGRNLGPLIKKFPVVIGVDSSKTALECCNKNYPNASNLVLLLNSLDNIQLLPESIDTIMCDHVLTHVRNVESAIEQFYKLLRKGGYGLIEFTSFQDSTYGKGKKLSENEFIQNGVYLRYDEPEDIERLLKDFNILCFTSELSTDPPHGSGYIRKERHNHHSYFVVALKE